MKLITTLLLVFASLLAFSTHNRAGEITYEWVSGYTYEITVRIFAIENMADRDSIDINFGDGTPQQRILRVNGPLGPSGVPQGEFFQYADNTKYNFYITEHTFPGVGIHTISVKDPNRIGSTININGGNSVNVEFYIESEIMVLDPSQYSPNNSPKVFSPAIVNGKLNVPLQYNLTAGDIDGDSLAFTLESPLQTTGVNVPNYQFPDDVSPNPDVFEIDSISGIINWDSPQQLGIYAVAILITEYRNGYKIGSVLQDLQFLITDDNVNIQGNFDTLIYKTTPNITLNIGDTLNVTANFNIGANINNYWLKVHSPLIEWAYTTYVNSYSPNKISGNFTMVIDSSLARIQPYILTFRGYTYSTNVSNFNAYMTDESLLIYIRGGQKSNFVPPIFFNSINTPHKENSTAIVFPNPVTNYLKINTLNDAKNNYTLVVYHIDGKAAKSYSITNNSPIDVSQLTAGLYIYQIWDENLIAASGKFIKK